MTWNDIENILVGEKSEAQTLYLVKCYLYENSINSSQYNHAHTCLSIDYTNARSWLPLRSGSQGTGMDERTTFHLFLFI